MDQRVKERVDGLTVNPVLWDCSLAPFTSFGIGGPAEGVITVESPEELGVLLQFFAQNGIAHRFIGRGSNLLVRDAGFKGIVLLPGKGLSTIELLDADTKTVVVRAGSGCSLTKLLNWCSRNSYAGLEFTAGIPGSLGGAVVMNAGAWGGQMADVLLRLDTMDTTAERVHLEKEQLDFSYRSWNNLDVYGKSYFLLAADILLQRGVQEEIADTCRQYRERREQKQPKGVKNCGSFFKNPPGDSAGRLIESAGLKGRCCGDAMISEVHANFLVNRGAATADDVLRLMRIVQDKVVEECGILLKSEVHFL